MIQMFSHPKILKESKSERAELLKVTCNLHQYQEDQTLAYKMYMFRIAKLNEKKKKMRKTDEVKWQKL